MVLGWMLGSGDGDEADSIDCTALATLGGAYLGGLVSRTRWSNSCYKSFFPLKGTAFCGSLRGLVTGLSWGGCLVVFSSHRGGIDL